MTEKLKINNKEKTETRKRVELEVADQPTREAFQDVVSISREDANTVVDHLVDWYESQKQNE